MMTDAMDHRLPAIAACLALALWLSAPPATAQEIYRVVDEDGNVTYTDQDPEDGSKPVDLPELSVVQPDELGDPEAAGDAEPGRRSHEALPLLDFRIISPSPEEAIANAAMQVPVQIELGVDMPPGAQIVILVDGQPAKSLQSTTTTLEDVEHGPHELRAELQTASGRVLASTDPVIFFMREQSDLRPGSD